jgi:hypothetical protein
MGLSYEDGWFIDALLRSIVIYYSACCLRGAINQRFLSSKHPKVISNRK